MRFSWRTEWPHLVLIAAMFVMAASQWGTAPDRIPVHWNIHGQIDRYGGKVEGLLAMPAIALVVYLAMLLLPRVDPGRANYEGFAGVYATLRLAVLVVLAGVYGVVLLSMRGRSIDSGAIVSLLVGALLVLVGNLLGKVRPNWFVGIRTPWTLSSKLSWTHTHRAGRWIFIATGLLLMATAGLHGTWVTWTVVGFGAAGVFGLVVYSYRVWRRDPDKTPPAGTLPA
jgi:uncharacterized membrane protein